MRHGFPCVSKGGCHVGIKLEQTQKLKLTSKLLPGAPWLSRKLPSQTFCCLVPFRGLSQAGFVTAEDPEAAGTSFDSKFLMPGHAGYR